MARAPLRRLAAAAVWGCLLLPAAAWASPEAAIRVPDVLCLPGESVFVRASLVRTGLLGMVRPGIPGEVLEFLHEDGRPMAALLTDVSGTARVPFTPSRPGVVRVRVRLAPTPRVHAEPASGRLFAREKKRPLFFVTVEGGLYRPEEPGGLFGRPGPGEHPPLAGAREALQAAAACSTLVYLAALPESRREDMRAWLDRHAFPEAPVLPLESAPDPENPGTAAWRTDLFASLRDAQAEPPVLVTGNADLASRASDDEVQVYLLDRQEGTEAGGKAGEPAGAVRRVTGWEHIPPRCGKPPL